MCVTTDNASWMRRHDSVSEESELTLPSSQYLWGPGRGPHPLPPVPGGWSPGCFRITPAPGPPSSLGEPTMAISQVRASFLYGGATCSFCLAPPAAQQENRVPGQSLWPPSIQGHSRV